MSKKRYFISFAPDLGVLCVEAETTPVAFVYQFPEELTTDHDLELNKFYNYDELKAMDYHTTTEINDTIN